MASGCASLRENDMADFEETRKRYIDLLHAVQSGIAAMMNYGNETDPKHLRVGVNSAMINDAALVELLIVKGIITREEYLIELVKQTEFEKQRYEVRLEKILGHKITLV